MKIRPMTFREKNNLFRWRSKKTKKNRPQKFQRGDVVYISPKLRRDMSHFDSDEYAIILYSYNDKYGGGNTEDYALFQLKGGYESCWYPESCLTRVEI